MKINLREVGCGLNSFGSVSGPVAGPSGSERVGSFLNQLNDGELLKKYFMELCQHYGVVTLHYVGILRVSSPAILSVLKKLSCFLI
jgi:hypothetical protein